jgi:hypothetical protein
MQTDDFFIKNIEKSFDHFVFSSIQDKGLKQNVNNENEKGARLTARPLHNLYTYKPNSVSPHHKVLNNTYLQAGEQ